MLPVMLEQDRKRAGWSVGQAAGRLGVSLREYRELEAGVRSPSFETWDPNLQDVRLAADVRGRALIDLATGPSYGAPVVLLENAIRTTRRNPQAPRPPERSGILVALVAVVTFVAALAVVMAR